MPKPSNKPSKSAATKPTPPVARSRLVRIESAKPARSVSDKSRTSAVKPEPRSLCPINLALELIGDAWTLLIIRDLMLRGHSSYQAFLRSGEKIATNILADRLAKLDEHGLVTKSADPADARKFIYALTQKGADLAPLLVEMTAFSHKYAPRVDMPKDVLAELLRNKQAFATRLVRACAPKAKPRPRAKPPTTDTTNETLSLF